MLLLSTVQIIRDTMDKQKFILTLVIIIYVDSWLGRKNVLVKLKNIKLQGNQRLLIKLERLTRGVFTGGIFITRGNGYSLRLST